MARTSPLLTSALFAVAAAVMVAGCGDDGDDTATDDAPGSSTTMPDDTSTSPPVTSVTGEAVGTGALDGLTLTAEVAVDGSSLVVTYRVDNGSEQPVVVADAVPVPQGNTHGPDSTDAWVTASSHGFVTVGKFPVVVPPETAEGTLPLSLYMRRVEPGGHMEGRIERAWPLVGHHPYLPPDQLPVPLPDPVESLRLCIGIDPSSPEIDGSPVVEEERHTWLAVPMDQLRETLCTEPQPLAG